MSSLPPKYHQLQFNFCKTIGCDNFASHNQDDYIIQYMNPARPAMVCKKCGAFPPILSNQLIDKEWRRQIQRESQGMPSCHNIECENLGLSVYHHKNCYHAFGFSGDRQRYRCKACRSTFVDKWAGENKKVQLQEQLLALLFTGYSVQEICTKLEIKAKVFYDHIEHIASRCRKKQAQFDTLWYQKTKNYQIATYCQALQPASYNGALWVASADPNSGFVLSQHLNYDAEACDSSSSTSFETHALELSTPAFYVDIHSVVDIGGSVDTDLDLQARIEAKYKVILSRNNVEDPLNDEALLFYPKKGQLVFAPYTSYAHFLNIQRQCKPDRELTLYLPQEPLLRSAAISIFYDKVQQNKLDMLYVIEPYQWDQRHKYSKPDIVHAGWWKDRWAMATQKHRYTKQVMEKGICHITGDKHDNNYWMRRASLSTVTRYQAKFHAHFASFIHEPRRKSRPAGIIPLLDIFRAWNNLCSQDRQGQTPAMKQGLINHPLSFKQLLT